MYIPFVSIVIPVYNSEDSIVETLNSIVVQTFTNFEIIIIDDGSSDASKKLIINFISLHPNLNILYFFQSNKGVSAARNLGLKKSKGEYIALLDSDDCWAEEKLSLQVEIMMKNPNICLLSCNRNDEKFNQFAGHKFSTLTKISAKLLLYKNFMITPTVIFRKKIIEKIGYFNENQKYTEDLEYFIRIAHRYDAYLYNVSLVTTGKGKLSFGHSGLSANLIEMEKGEIKTIKMAYKLGVINMMEYPLIILLSVIKFIRRYIITCFYKIQK